MIRVARRLPELQFVRFCAVGASGYAVNLAVYAALLEVGLHYLAAAAIAFLVAAASNYLWNRTWTFRTSDAPVLGQGARAFVVSALSLGANQLFLFVFVTAGAGHLAARFDLRHVCFLGRLPPASLVRCPRLPADATGRTATEKTM